MPNQHPIPTQLNIAPRGKSWKNWQLVDGPEGFPTREAMEKYHCNPERVRELEECRERNLETIDRLNALLKKAQCQGCAVQDGTHVPNETLIHPDDMAVDALAAAMKAKLAKKRAQGFGGWDTDCTQERLSELLRGHMDKGDPVDVANFCAFLLARGEGIAASQQGANTESEAIAEITSAGHDGAEFGERAIKLLRDFNHLEYGTKLYAHPTTQGLPLCTEVHELRRVMVDCQHMLRSWNEQRAATADQAKQGGVANG